VPAEERHTIAQHLRYCSSCAEELAVVRAFDFAPPQPQRAQDHGGRVAADHASVLTRLRQALASLVLHPAFAYGIALLLGIRVASYDLLPHFPSVPDVARSPSMEQETGPEWSASPTRTETTGPSAFPQNLSPRATALALLESHQTVVPPHLSPQEAAVVLLEAYKMAYEARDSDALSRLGNLREEGRTEVAQLFAESRRLSLLLDVQSVQVNEKEDRASVKFTQVTTVVSTDGRFYTKGPESHVADLRRRGDRWDIQDLQRAPD
jgi:hypothetical protein